MFGNRRSPLKVCLHVWLGALLPVVGSAQVLSLGDPNVPADFDCPRSPERVDPSLATRVAAQGDFYDAADWIVALVPISTPGQAQDRTCIGALVTVGSNQTPRVLTAAHCFDGPHAKGAIVGHGVLPNSTPTAIKGTATRIVGADLILLEIESLPRNVKPRRLARSTPQEAMAFHYAFEDGRDALYTARYQLRPRAVCDRARACHVRAGYTSYDPEPVFNPLCAGRDGYRLEVGDSGGPLLVWEDSEWKIAGVHHGSSAAVTGADVFERADASALILSRKEPVNLLQLTQVLDLCGQGQCVEKGFGVDVDLRRVQEVRSGP